MQLPSLLDRLRRGDQNAHTILKIVLTLLIGILLGFAIVNPYHRIIEILVGFFIAAAAILIKPSRAITAFVVIFLFPAQLSIGTSNTVFIMLLLSVWMAQQVLAGKKISIRTPLDLPIILMGAAYLVSMSNVPQGLLGTNIKGLSLFFTCVAIYYLVVNLTPDYQAIRRLLWAGIVGAAIIAAIGLVEVFFPGKELLPYFLTARMMPADVRMVRAGSVFKNVSLLSQYSVFYMLLFVFLIPTAKSRFLKTLLVVLFAAYLVVFASTAMRGALLAGLGGLAFLVWRGRHIIDTRKLVLGMLVCLAVFVLAHSVLSNAGLVLNIWDRFSLLGRRVGSHVSREAVMREVFDRGLEHPFIGHGPVIQLPRGFVAIGSNNPHCQYLYYFYTIGLLGLSGFIWLIVNLFRVSSQAIRLRGGNENLRQLMLILQLFLVIFVLHETLDDYSNNFIYPLFIWYLFGLIVAARNVMFNEARTPALAPTSTPNPSPSPRTVGFR